MGVSGDLVAMDSKCRVVSDSMAFVAAALAFAIGRPDLSNSGLFTTAVIIIVYWLATFLSLQGGNLFAKVSSYGGMIGTIIRQWY